MNYSSTNTFLKVVLVGIPRLSLKLLNQEHLLVLISDYVLDLDAVELTTVATVFLFILSRTTIIMLCTKLFLNNGP